MQRFNSPQSNSVYWTKITVSFLTVIFLIVSLVQPQIKVLAAALLTIAPLTWDVVGLDSVPSQMLAGAGPNNFPVGARVCNSGDAAATNVLSSFVWDPADPSPSIYINSRPGSLTEFTVLNGRVVPSLAPGSCYDFVYEVQITRNSSAYDTHRRYYITTTATGLGTSSTSKPREIYVEHLISQNRNATTNIKLDGVSIPAGGSMSLMVGNTYQIELYGSTATQGYNQIESFVNFSNTIFQILSVSTLYSADSSLPSEGGYVPNPSDMLYGDGCLWDDDPSSPTYRSCTGIDGKAGGDIKVTFSIKIIGGTGTTETLHSLIYDFSGSSYHYNADYSVTGRIVNIIGPSSVTIQKTFTPRAIAPGGTSIMTIKLTNPTSETIYGVNFTDTFPAGLAVVTPGTTSVCSGSLVTTSNTVSFSGGTLSPNSVCTTTLNVTAASAGTYPNTTDHLFINTSMDTGNFGSDTLTAASTPDCILNQTIANWTVPVGTISNPPDAAGGIPTTKASNVSIATTSAFLPLRTSIVTTGGSNDSTAWSTWGYSGSGQYVDFVIDTSKYSGVSMSFYVKNDGISQGPTSLVVSYNTGSGFTNILSLTDPADTFTLHTIDFTGKTNTSGNTTFRLIATGANNNNQGAGLVYDDIKYIGCGIPAPAPTITKSFLSDPIIKGTTSTIRFSINNTSAGNQALTGIAFSDVLPAGLSIATLSNSVCNAGTLTTTAGTRTIALTGGSLAAGGSCNFDVTVTGTTQGHYDNVSGYITSTQSGTSTNYATDSMTVIAPTSLAKSFSPGSIFTGNDTTLTFIITNPNLSSSLNGIGFTDILPAGVTVATSGPTSTCGGSLSTTMPSTVSFSGGSLAANSSCTFNVTVTGAYAGTIINSTNAGVSSTEGGNGNIASASLVVNDQTALIDLTKQVSTSASAPWTTLVGQTVSANIYYRFSVYNAGDLPFSEISVSDATLLGLGFAPASCAWKDSSGAELTFPLISGDTAYCILGPTPAVAGFHSNTAQVIGTYASGTKAASSSASYGTPQLTLTKSVTETYFISGTTLHYGYLVKNTGFVSLLGPVTVSDNKTGVTCPAVNTVGDSDDWLDVGESITCNAPYAILPTDLTAGFVKNLAQAAVSGVNSNPDTKTVQKAPDLTVTKSNNLTGNLTLGGTFVWKLTVSSSPNTKTATFSNTQTVLTDDLPAGPTYGPVTVTPSVTNLSCTIILNVLKCTASEGDVSILTDTSFEITFNVTPAAAGTLINPATTCKVDPSNSTPETDDTNNLCGPDTVIVDNATPTVTTDIHNVNHDIVISVLKGALVHDSASVLGLSSPFSVPGGTIDFTFYPTIDCSGTGAASGSGIALSGGVAHPSSSQGPLSGGSYSFKAHYSGDLNYLAADGPCEPLFVEEPALTLVKSVTSGDPFSVVGAVISYGYVIKNTGNVTLSGPFTVSDDKATDESCPVTASLAPGASITCTASYTITQADLSAGSVTNKANASADGTTSNTDSVTVNGAKGSLMGIAKRVVGTPALVSPGTWEVTYEILVKNYGNAALSALQVTDNLSTTFPAPTTFTVRSVSSAAFTKNWSSPALPTDYNGNGNNNLLTGVDTLAAGALGTGTITVVVWVVPASAGPFNNNAIASGLPPSAPRVTDDSSDGTDPDSTLPCTSPCVFNGDDNPNNNTKPTPVTFGPHLFDPPFGIKQADARGLPILHWTMVWINNTNVSQIHSAVSDPIPVGTTYVAGSILCTPASILTHTDTCLYESPSLTYPRGRILWTGVIGPDFGATDATSATNELTITFNVTVNNGVTSAENEATIDSDLNGDGDTNDSGEQNVDTADASWRDLPDALPSTGFAPDRETILPSNTISYNDLGDLWLEIPRLGVKMPIVGVPLRSGEWDVSWLGSNAGWLNGTAYPTWAGNSVMTGHVYDAYGQPAPFVHLNWLWYGDKMIVHAMGAQYVYEVREVKQVAPDAILSVLKHEQLPWVTLVTCRGYDETSDSYKYRVVVRAVLVEVK